MLHRLTAGLFLALVACAAFGLAGPLIAPTGALAPVSAAAAPLDYSAQAAVTVADSPPGRLPAADQPPADPPPTPPAAEGQPAGKQPATDAAPAGAPADTQEVALEDADALLEQLAVDESLPVEAADATISVKPGRFKVDLYREGIHVRQVNNQTCVATSIQMMANIMDSRKPDRTKQRQLDLYQFARGASRTASVAGQVGITASGWANALNELGYGKYKSMTLPSREKALRTAARQMRLTGKPVGMFVWDGIHAWVMSGFQATADPARTDDFEITAVWIEDPWYRWRDRNWGAGLAPHTKLTPDEMARWFVNATWGKPGNGAERYIIVVPTK